MVHLLQLSIWDSEFRIQFRYLVFTVFPDLKSFQHKSIKTKTKRKILPQPIIFNTDKALTYPKFCGKGAKCNKNLKLHFDLS